MRARRLLAGGLKEMHAVIKLSFILECNRKSEELSEDNQSSPKVQPDMARKTTMSACASCRPPKGCHGARQPTTRSPPSAVEDVGLVDAGAE